MKKEVKNDQQLNATEKQGKLSRRTFLSGTGSAALAVAATGLLGSRALGKTNDAPPTEQDTRTTIPNTIKPGKKYPHLLSPMKIGNHVLKNRMIGTASSPHLLPGPELCPHEAITYYYANKARAGASLIVLSQPIDVHVTSEEDVIKIKSINPNLVNPDHGGLGFHFTTWDLANAGCQNKFSQLTEAVHFYDALCIWKPKVNAPAGYDATGGPPLDAPVSTVGNAKGGIPSSFLFGGSAALNGGPPADNKEITEEMLQKIIEEVALKAALSKECGFDGLFLHCGYRAPLTARLMSPLTNHRKDKYGGSLENRARFTIELADAIKKRCGQDYFIMASMSGCEPKGGYTVDDAVEFAKLFTGHIDLLDVKGDPVDQSHPTNFNPEHTPFLYITERMKKLGVKMPLVCDGGFTNLDWAEDAISSGKTDAVGISRGFITTPDLGRLAFEGRNEDVVPCLRCNTCHGGNNFKPWNSTCAVNPVWGLEHKIDQMIAPPTEKKKVAVIGGGPAGMKAALVSAQRGHAVTLYEKTGSLGGIFKKIETVSFKWTHRDYKNYLVRQVEKAGVKVRLNTEADPAMIRKEGFDAVIVAIGADPVVPDIPGAKGKHVVSAVDVYGNESSLSKNVVIVGGGDTGTETGIHLAQKGHQVTVLEKSRILARDAVQVHFYPQLEEAWEKLPNFKAVMQAHCNGITEDGVTYIDADGKQQSIKAGSVVLAVGMKAKNDLAFTFHEAGDRFYMVGDCRAAGDLQEAIRSAFSTASRI